MATNIPVAVKHCLDQFKGLEAVNDSETLGSDEYDIKNELDRFKVWVGNLAAHRPMGKRSLEYRLRDAEDLRSSVLDLLSDLSSALHRYTLPDPGEESASSEDEDELDFQYDELAMRPPNALRDIHDTINLLYQFSTTLRNPARQNRIKEGLTSMKPFYSEVYIKLVQDKFAHAPQYLAERLGGAVSSRRQYFKYREDHKTSMSAGLDDIPEGRSTVASSIPKAVEYVHDIQETESTYSMTSYAPTDSETSNLRPPTLPEAGLNGDPFECPICYNIVQVTGEASWKRHFFEDLAPYTCTRENCRIGNKMYTRRRDWQRHETHMHDRIWICPFGCGAEYRSAEDLNPHLLKIHGHLNQGGRSTRIAHALSRPTDVAFDLKCPLCKKDAASMTLWFKHVARHMEQLALQAVDSHKLATDSDEDDLDGPDHVSEKVVRYYGSSSGDPEPDPDDPAEPKYCYCNRVSYGEMVACDNESCPRQWFHIGCTELRKVPGEREKWYCEGCRSKLFQEREQIDEATEGHEYKEPFPGRGSTDFDNMRKEMGYQRISIACAHCRRRKIRCLVADDSEDRCQNCIRLKKECVFYPVDQQAAMDALSAADEREWSEAEQMRRRPEQVGYDPDDRSRRETIASGTGTGLHRSRSQGHTTSPTVKLYAPDVAGQEESSTSMRTENPNSGQTERWIGDEKVLKGVADLALEDQTSSQPSGVQNEAAVDETTLHPGAREGMDQVAKTTEDQDEAGYKNRLQIEKIRAEMLSKGAALENTREEIDKAGESFQADMRTRLRALGYSEQQIGIMIDGEKAEKLKGTDQTADILDVKRPPRAPTWPKVRREYIEIDTLKYYDLPWKYDSNDPDYLIIMRDMDKRETDLLFEHTSRLRSGKLLLEPDKKDKQSALYPRRLKSRSDRPDLL